MRKPLLLLMLFIASVVFAQKQSSDLTASNDARSTKSKSTDSLHQLFLQTRSDTARVDLLIILADAYYDQQVRDSALWYAQQALDLARKINYQKGQFSARSHMAIWLRRLGRYPQALQLLLTNLQTSEWLKDTLGMKHTNWLLTFTYWAMSDFAKVLEYARKDKQLVHSGFFRTQVEVKRYSLGYMSLMGDAFEGLNQLDSALYYFQRCYTTALSLKDNQWLANATRGLGSTLTKRGHYNEAFSYFRSAISYGKAAEGSVVAFSYLGLAKLFDQKKQMDSALYYSQLALSTLQHLKFPAQELKPVSYIYELFAKQNRIDSAYKYLVLATTLKDSLFNPEKTRQVQNLQFNEILRLQQLAQQRKESQQRYATDVKLYTLVAGLTVVMLIAFILYRNNQQKQKANALLERQKQEIDQQRSKAERALEELKLTQAQLVQREKMASLGELTAGIAHEIQNPLNFVNNFSEVSVEMLDEQKEQINRGNKEEAISIAEEVKENLQKVVFHGKRADAIVKGMLQHSRTSTAQKELTDINALADEYLRLSYHGLRAKDKLFNATIETYFDESVGKIEVIPQEIGRVFLNLFNNAFYAVTEKKKQLNEAFEPQVSVSTARSGETIEIRVKDNGPGIPPKVVDKIFQPFFTTKPTGQGTGLGLSLSYDIVKAHGGEIKVKSKEGEGAEFIIQLALK